ncbi:MAG TPA: winged helix-turn-helix domain-containing protein [Pyrinomonadaceae bacterium]|nr:winged helix-turn-helix domain-containing protein [Pyrinomonadaceae bacterium]
MQRLSNQTLSFADVTLDLTRGCLLRGEAVVKLRPKSFEVLKHLVENSGRLVSKEELIGAVWAGTAVTDDSLVQCLIEVRRALGVDGPHIIKTVPRRGYIFDAEVLEHDPAKREVIYTEEVEGLSVIVEDELSDEPALSLSGVAVDLKHRIDPGTEMEISLTSSLFGKTHSTPGSTLERAKSSTTIADDGHSIPARSSEAVSRAEYVATQIKNHKNAAAVLLTLVGLAVIGLVFGTYKFLSKNRETTASQPMKLTRLTAHGKALNTAISPDGRYVAYVLNNAGMQSIVLRQIATSSSREMVPPSDDYFLGLTFTPDGNFLHYVKRHRDSLRYALYKVGLLGGDSRQVLDDIDSPVTFSPDGKKLAFVRGYLEGPEFVLFIANADGTSEERVTSRKAPIYTAMDYPAWSPDGRSVAFIVLGTDAQGYFVNIDEVRVADKSERKISTDRWRQINSIAWTKDGASLIASARDRASIAGSPLQLWNIAYVDGQARRITSDVNNYVRASLSADTHTLIAVLQDTLSNVWVVPGTEVSRAQQITSTNRAGSDGLVWTPDGKIIFTAIEAENRDLWIMNSDGSSTKQLTFESSPDFQPAITPDGRYIVFVSNRGAGFGIWRVDTDGNNPKELSKGSIVDQTSNPKCSSDSQGVLYTADQSGKRVLLKTPIGGGAPTPLAERMSLYGHSLSPDGKLIAFFSRKNDLQATLQVQIISFENGSVVKTIDISQGAFLLKWSPDGRSLNYAETKQGVSNIWSLPLDGGQSRQLTDWKADRIFEYQWSPDGKRLAVSRGGISNDLVLIEDLGN